MGKKVIVVRSDSDGATERVLRIAGLALLGVGVVAGLGLLLARDQMTRHQNELFSPHPLRRLAALGYLRSRPGIDNVLLLRDYLAWEARPLLRKKAAGILVNMESYLESSETVEEA
ncbi:MAG: hypothetical protein ACE5HF_03555 [Gemmatimonadota bacterium]